MATVDPARYNDLCRLCATKTTILLGVHIFQNDGIMSQLRKKIETCLPIQVHETDELPKMICENCLFKLNLLSEFREKTLRTERLLLDLIKGIHTNKLENHQDHQSINVVSIDSDLIMVQHQQLLNNHDLSNVGEIHSLHQLNSREQMIVGHEIILTHPHNHHHQHHHQNVDLVSNHNLDSIDLNHHELTQDLSNHSLQTQDSILVETTNGRYSNNLELIQHQQLLNDQFRLQHELHVNMTETNGVGDIGLDTELEDQVVTKMNGNIQHSDTSYRIPNDKKHIDFHDSDMNNTNHTDKLDALKSEDANNSNTDLLINDQLNKTDKITNKDVYIIQTNDDNLNTNSLESTSTSNETDWFCCNICGKAYEEENNFQSHYSTHFHKCEICNAVFMNSDLLNSHHKEVHENLVENEQNDSIKTRSKSAQLPINQNNLNNDDDDNTDDSDDDLDNGDDDDEHEKNTNEVPEIENNNSKKKVWSPKICTECGKSYKTNYKLNEHMRKHTGEKPYKCTSCDKEFRSKIGLAQHAAKHTGKYDYSCSTCGKGFQCKSYLMVHQRVHSDLKPYPCTTCGRNFKTKQSLLDHTNRHLGVKPYMCEICGRGFITKGLCKAHQKVHTGLDNRKYSCKVCNKMFVSKSYLQTHLRIHTGEKPFMCEVCGKGFLTKVDLRIHTTMHTGEKSYVCEMCGKAFARRDALRCHRRSHTGERPYSCDLCGQTFTQFTPMAIHKRLHTGERPYACETCGKTFVSRSTMMSHAKKHLQ